MRTKIITILFIAIAKLSFGQYQQYQQLLTPYLADSIQSGFFYFNTPNNFPAGVLYQLYRQSVPDLNNNMILIDQHVDSLAGLTHFKYQQTFMNVPIEGAGCIEHYDKYGSLLFINAKIADSIKSEVAPRITAKEAIQRLISELQRDERNKFAWESDEWEQQIRIDQADSNATWFPTAELIWAIDTLKNVHLVIPGYRYKLAYQISITTIDPFETIIYYIDANNGSILKIQSTCIYDGPANIQGYGSKIIDTQWKGGFTQKYILQTNDASRVIHTKKNPNGSTAWWLLDNTKDNDDNWGTSFDTETTTHYHVSNSWDYFKNVFGRTGQNNQGREVRVRTQWANSNASFTPGGSDHNDLKFGSTSLGGYYGAEPSVVAHEFTHGVTHHSSNLTYSYESGALNESFSDIFGIVIHAAMMDGGSTDWLYGNFVTSSNEEIRSFKAPNNFGSHIDALGNLVLGQPDTYEGTYWFTEDGDAGGVHINSGVQNKWFYILANGEDDVNDLNNYYDVNGIGITKAARISYYALTSILQSASQYTDSRQATIQAAKILFGECSIEHQATIDSWYAVGLGNLNDCQYTLAVDDITDQNLVIYPNPTSEILNVELPTLTSEKIQLFDLTGKLVNEFKNDNLVFKTDISQLQNGVYIIRFCINGEVFNKRFVVQK